MNRDNKIIVGIDAANARTGGGVTYLVELLRASDPESFGIKKVIIGIANHIFGFGKVVMGKIIPELTFIIDLHTSPGPDKRIHFLII